MDFLPNGSSLYLASGANSSSKFRVPFFPRVLVLGENLFENSPLTLQPASHVRSDALEINRRDIGPEHFSRTPVQERVVGPALILILSKP